MCQYNFKLFSNILKFTYLISVQFFKKKLNKNNLISLYDSNLLHTTMLNEESTWRPRCAQFDLPIRKKDHVGKTLYTVLL